MHKKRIKGKAYFYTSYRDENGKVRTRYLGRNEKIAKKRESDFKSISINPWKPYIVLLLVVTGILFLQNFNKISFTTIGASILDDYQISAEPPSASDVGIHNATPYFNTSIFGYGNYSDADFDDSNGTSTYKWFVNEVENKTGATGQLLLCHFNNNYTCEEGETANITQYHTEFIVERDGVNTTKEGVNVTLTEKNSSIVYVNIPKTATLTEAFMNVSGYLTSAYDLLKFDSNESADYENPGASPNSNPEYFFAGVRGGVGIDSWFLITNTTNLSTGLTANMLAIRYGNAIGTPSNGNFTYNIKICPTSLTRLTDTNEPVGNCTSSYVDIIDTVNLSSNFSDSATGGWQNFTFNDNVSITFDNSSNFILKLEFVDGDLSGDRYWDMYIIDDGTKPFTHTLPYVAYNHSGVYYSQVANHYLQFYSKSRYPKGVEVNIGNDEDIDFADTNESFDTVNTTYFASEISEYLSSCSDTYCDIPINVSSNSSGIIGLEALRISYDHYDLDGKFLQGMIANYTYITKYGSDNNMHNHNGTLDIWVKPYWDGGDGNEYTFFTDSNNIIQLNKSSTNNLVFFVDDTTVSYSISSWTARAWHLITATWNQGENINLYVDGSNKGSNNAPSTISSLGEFIFIGTNAENSSQVNATIDELRITGFPRESDEINNYYSESRAFYQNEVFLNSTDTQLKRDDNVTFELTPSNNADGSGTAGISEINISNCPPIMPILNQPANDTYISLPYSFSWNNATDYDKEDTLYYVLQIGDKDFSEPVTYYNGSISETSSPTSDIVTGVDDGNYSWKVLSSDLTINSSFTEPRVVTIDSTAPNLTFISPAYRFVEVNSSEDKEIILYFNVSDFNPLENCTLNINETAEPTINQTLTAINQTENNFTTTLAFGGYNWSINCTDIANNINTTGKTVFSFVAYNNFTGKGRTTNFSALDDPTNVTNLTIENPEYGVINFTGVDLNLAGGLDIDTYISISFNEIKIDDTGVPTLNTSANLTLFNLTLTDLYVLKDGFNCSTECTVVDDSSATYTFSIESGGTYTTSGVPLPAVPPPTPTGGHGGGGGTRTLTKRSSFTFDTGLDAKQFVLQMKQGAQHFKKIEITNDGELTLAFNLFHNLGEHLAISPQQFKLEPEYTKTVSVKFYANEPGLYIGKIVITTNTIQKIIPVTLEVRSEKIVVDAKLEMMPEYTEIKQGDPLKAQVTLFNTANTKVPIVITYIIKDLEGNIVAEEVETFDILDKKSFIKTFDTSNLKAGSYVTGMNVQYKDSFTTSSARFEVKGEAMKKPLFEFKTYHIVIIISIFILIMLLKLRSTDFRKVIRKKKRKLKKYED